MGKLFGTDGVRGEANRYPMNAEIAFAIGQAVVYVLKKKHARPRIIIGKDTRISGYMLESSLESGITSMGGNPYLVRVLPTPGIAFIAQSMRADAGIVISASHNPYQDNGIKIFSGNGFKLSDEQEAEIEELMLSNTLHTLVPAGEGHGAGVRPGGREGPLHRLPEEHVPARPLDRGDEDRPRHRQRRHVQGRPGSVLGAGGGRGGHPQHPQRDQHQRQLRLAAHAGPEEQGRSRRGAAIGLAFDGDGDRLIAVDEKGQEITGDQILLICASILKQRGKLKNDLLVSTVMSNLGLRVACRKYGFRHHASKVGDRYVLEDMLRLGGVIGGEDSGHMIFLDHHTTGDGIITALQLIAAMVRTGKPLSELARMMDVYPQKLINVDVKSKPDIATVPELVALIEKVERELGDEGRVLVRYSGTQNMCRVMVEGPTESVTEKYCSEIADIVKSVLADAA